MLYIFYIHILHHFDLYKNHLPILDAANRGFSMKNFQRGLSHQISIHLLSNWFQTWLHLRYLSWSFSSSHLSWRWRRRRRRRRSHKERSREWSEWSHSLPIRCLEWQQPFLVIFPTLCSATSFGQVNGWWCDLAILLKVATEQWWCLRVQTCLDDFAQFASIHWKMWSTLGKFKMRCQTTSSW